jgi:hypothetical protein
MKRIRQKNLRHKMADWQAMPLFFCQRFFCLLLPLPISRFGQIGEVDGRRPVFRGVFLSFFERRIKIRSHVYDGPTERSRLARLWARQDRRNEACHGLIVFSNHNILTRREVMDQVCQPGLGLLNRYLCHISHPTTLHLRQRNRSRLP